MALAHVRFFSQSLEKCSEMVVLLPEGDRLGPYPVWYLLHGLSDDCTAWSRYTTIQRAVEGLPLVVVMPDGGRGYYTDNAQGPAWEAHFFRDVVPFVERTFSVRTEGACRVVSGHSMGGYGAIKFALRRPDMFVAAVGHSGAYLAPFERTDPEGVRIFGRAPAGGPDDLLSLVASASGSELPALRLDCGTDDYLLHHSRSLHDRLMELGIEHDYHEYAGAHTWDYWQQRLPQTVAFVARQLGLR
ncbi:MAG: esterase [Fimbriimonadales bacterium]